MLKLGYEQSDRDHMMFVMANTGGKVVLLIYVDDIIIMGDDEVEIQRFELKIVSRIWHQIPRIAHIFLRY